MGENEYRISLGVQVETDDIKSQLNTAEAKLDPIKIKIDAETKELANTIKTALKSLTSGTKNALTLNTDSLEASLKDVSASIKDIKTSLGTLDSKSGMKSLLASINQISAALEKASNQFESLNSNLNALSGKDLSLNFGINLGSSNSVARNAVYGSKVRNETIPQLKQQMSDLVKYYNTTYKQSLNEFEALQKLVSGTKLNNGDFFENFLFGKDSVASRMNGGSLASQMQAYKQYIDMFKQAASLKGLDLSSVTSGFSKSADDLIKDAQDIQTGAKEMEDSFEKLKQVFGGGNNLNIEGISAQLDSIVVDLGEIKTALQGLSSGVSLDGLTQSFNRLSETIEKLVSNVTLAKNTLGDGLDNVVSSDRASKQAQEAKKSADTVVQSEERKQQAFKETAAEVKKLDNVSTSSGLDAVKVKEAVSDADRLSAAFSKLKNIQGNINKIKIGEIDTSKGAQELQTLENQLESLSAEYNETVAEINGMGGLSKTQFQSLQNQVNTIGLKLEQLKSKVVDARTSLAKNLEVKLETGKFAAQVDKVASDANKLGRASDEVEAEIKELNLALTNMKTAATNGDIEKLISSYRQYEIVLESVENQLKRNKIAQQDAAAQQKLADDRNVFQSKIDTWLTKNTAASKKFGAQMRELRAAAESCDRVTLNHLESEFKQIDNTAEAAGLKVKSFGDRIKAQFAQYSSYFSVASIFMYAEQGLRSMFEQIKLIDSAMTELKKVTDETDASYNQFLSNAATRSKEIGTTIDGLVSSTADFARLGYGFEDAQGLAEVANIYAVVGDEINGVEGATESLISTMAAFKNEMNGMSNSDFAMSIIDKFNEIGNNFAISSGGIGEALERSASSLMAANNTIDESIALITAANTVVQDPTAVGTAFKTISMRIRGAKTELEEAGLETEGMVESTAKLRQEILALSGVDIMENANEFKSTYKIMDELSAKWKGLTDIQQASVTELIAGKRQGNIVSSLMQNFDTARDALETSLNSSGSAMREHEKWQQSLEAQINKLKAAWQSLSQSFMNSDFLKVVLDTVIAIVDVLDKLTRSLGTFGTIGLGTSLFTLIRSGGLRTFFTAFTSLVSLAPQFGTLGQKIKGVGTAFADAGRLAKGSMSSFSAWTTGIGLAVAVIGLAVNAYKNYREEQSRLRQETIETSNEFLKASSSFEAAYIKYSGRTDLTIEEEAELESAIKGTVDALDDKSNALQNAVNSSNDYVTSLEAIAKAELKAANEAAQKKKKATEKELKSTAIGEIIDGSEVDVNLRSVDSILLAKEIMGKEYVKTTPRGKDNGKSSSTITLDANASVSDILDYYYKLVALQERMLDPDVNMGDTIEYDRITSAIGKMKDAVTAYEDGVYDAVKAQYQLQNGIPKTVEEYLDMRKSILKSKDIKGMSFDSKLLLASNLDSEYGQSFDLTTVEAQARKFVGVLKGYGDGTKDGSNEIGTVETFLNLRTAVNNNECSVGEYLSQYDEMRTMGEKWKGEGQEEFETSFGLDADAIKEQYDHIYNYFKRNYSKQTANNAKEVNNFLSGLSASELAAVVNIKSKIDWENATPEQVLQQIEEEAKLIEAMSFSINLELETEKLENLSTAITESLSGAGLGTESISLVEDMFGDLDGYNQSELFERTANGIRLNSDELRKLNDEYKKTNVDGFNDKVDALGEKYFQTREELSDLTYGTEEYNQKARELSDIEAQINATEKLAAQYEGLASAYQTWQRAEAAGSQRDMYESMIEGLENVDDEISRGWLDDGTIEFLRLIYGENISATATTEELTNAYKDLGKTIKYVNKEGKVLENTGYSIRDFFTVDEDGNSTNTGVYNFLDAIGRLEEEAFGGLDVVKRDGKGNIIGFDFQIAGGDKAIADALGISEELVQIMVRAADDAGFVVSMDGTYQQLDVLKEKAQEAANKLKEIFKGTDQEITTEFDLDTGSEESVLNQYQEALKIWETFKKNKNKDGTVNMSVEGAEEAYTLVSTLQSMVDKLSEPVYMKLNTTQVEKDLQEPLSDLQEYERLVQQENQLKLKGTDTSAIDKAQEEIVAKLEKLDPEIKAQLGIDGLTKEEIQAKVEAGKIEIPATIDLQVEMNNTMRDMVNVALYNAGIIDKEELEKRVDVNVYAENVDTSDVEKKTEDAVDDAVDKSTNNNGLPWLIQNYTPYQQKVIVEYFVEHKEVDDYTPEQKVALVEYIANSDNLDSYTPEEKQAIVEYLTDSSDPDNWTPEQKEAIAKFIKESGDVDSYTPEQKEAIAKFIKDSIEPDTYAPPNPDATVTFHKESSDVDGYDPPDIFRTVYYTIKETISKVASGGKSKAAQRTGADPDGKGTVNGTANVNGTTGRAFKQGIWGTKNSGTALGGELGTEILVRDGRWSTIGDNGAEFFDYRKGDIVFNHKQTEELFANGKVTSGGGRAKALVGGTAFAQGTALLTGSKGFGGIGKVVGNAVKKAVDDIKKAVTKDSEKSNKNSGSSSSSSGSKGSGGGTGKVENSSSVGSDKDTDKFEETFDWVETKISRIERAIDQLDRKANNVYKSWSSRNKALTDEISKVEDEIAIQQKAYDRYIQEANSVGLSSSWAAKVRNGEIDIDTITNETLAEKIKNYQKWYEKALACQDAIEELREAESKLYAQRFENIQAQYEGILQGYEHTEAMLNEYISQAEEQGYIVSKKYYQALIDNEKSNIAELKKEQADLIAERDNAVSDGKIEKYSEEWYKMCGEIDGVTQAIEEGETSLLSYARAMEEIDWSIFDLTQERISDITKEADFLIELMSNKKLFDDDGKLTSQGLATMALHGQKYNTHMYQADEYGAEVAKLDKQIAKDPYDQNLINRRNEVLKLQRESILAAEDEKNAIRDMVEEGINLELDALQERIDKYNESIDAAKDLYDYQKDVQEQSEEIASLEKQRAAYLGDDSEESKAKLQEIEVSLKEAKENLQETEYERYISDQQALLDTLYNEYELILNTRLDNIDYLLESVIESINSAASVDGAIATALGSEGAISIAIGNNATSIKDTLTSEANKVGTTLSSAMNSIWSVGEGNAKSVLTMYGEDFRTKSTTTITTLNGIKTSVNSMVSYLNKEAEKKVTANKTTTSAKKNPTTTTSANKNTTTTNNKSSNKPKITDDTLKGIAAAIWIYGKNSGWGNNPFRENKLTNKLGTSNAKKVQDYVNKYGASGGLYNFWIQKGKNLDKYKYSAFKLGARNIDTAQLAWTQENGQEFIVRPSDGAILTPVAKGDSVLTSAASNNIWNMANSPAEFIKDNLNFGTTSVPNNSNVQSNYIQHFENVTFSMPNVHGYNELLTEMQKDKNFEKLILSMTIDRINGKSGLAKGKSIR